MSISTMYKDITIDIPMDLYNALNRASREYDTSTTDIYYYVLNGSNVDMAAFDEMINYAMDKHFAYSAKKDIVSNDYVIPAVKNEYKVDDDSIITNNWNINFDGTNECKISDIKISKNNQKVIYTGDVSDDWVEKIGYVHAKIQIFDHIITKLLSSIGTNSNPKAKEGYDKVRDMRINLLMEEDVNRKQFLNEVVKQHIEGYDPDKCVWTLNPIEKTVVVVFETN